MKLRESAPIRYQLSEIRRVLRVGLGLESSPHLQLDSLIKSYDAKALNLQDVAVKYEQLKPKIIKALSTFCTDSIIENLVPEHLIETTEYIFNGEIPFSITVVATALDTAKVFKALEQAYSKTYEPEPLSSATTSVELGVRDPKKKGHKAMKIV